jgi:apolipoprotein N-acyltransferase
MSEQEEIGRKVSRLLDSRLGDIKQSTLNRLQSARRASLEGYHMTGTVVNVGQGVSTRSWHEWHAKTRKLLAVIALLFALGGVLYWHSFQQSDENEELDVMLLADDLPVDAYLDDEFDEWLNQP